MLPDLHVMLCAVLKSEIVRKISQSLSTQIILFANAEILKNEYVSSMVFPSIPTHGCLKSSVPFVLSSLILKLPPLER